MSLRAEISDLDWVSASESASERLAARRFGNSVRKSFVGRVEKGTRDEEVFSCRSAITGLSLI